MSATPSLRIASSFEPAQAEIDLVLSAMDAARSSVAAPVTVPQGNRRNDHRTRYRVRAELRLFADGPGVAPWVLFTRDAHARGFGFITRHRIPLGYGGWVDLTAPDGESVRASVTVVRCREAVGGWYEGAILFNRRQKRFG